MDITKLNDEALKKRYQELTGELVELKIQETKTPINRVALVHQELQEINSKITEIRKEAESRGYNL